MIEKQLRSVASAGSISGLFTSKKSAKDDIKDKVKSKYTFAINSSDIVLATDSADELHQTKNLYRIVIRFLHKFLVNNGFIKLENKNNNLYWSKDNHDYMIVIQLVDVSKNTTICVSCLSIDGDDKDKNKRTLMFS